MAKDNPDVTALLGRWASGDQDALQNLIPLVYGELRLVARRRLNRERAGHTFSPTDLVHEAYGRLVASEVPWRNRVHFFAVAAGTMRRVLVDHARTRTSQKRGGAARRVTLSEAELLDVGDPEAMLALHRALEKLSARDERKARVLELHFFSGLTYEETAEALSVSEATVDRDMRFARAWLQKELI